MAAGERKIVAVADADSVARIAAERLLSRISANSSRIAICLTGGSGPVKLYELQVTDAVPETIEASLQLSEAVLLDIGIPMGLVIASIREKRDEFRRILQAPEREADAVGRRNSLSTSDTASDMRSSSEH